MFFLGFQLTPFFIAILFSLTVVFPCFALEDVPGKEASIYSPVIQVTNHEGKGFVLVSTNSGVMWAEATPEAKPHLQHLAVGSLIDLTVIFRGKPLPPLIKSWKITSHDSPCRVFDGKTCSK